MRWLLLFLYLALVFAGYYIVNNYYHSQIGDLVVAFFGASLGGFLGIGAAFYIYYSQTRATEVAEERRLREAMLTEQRSAQQTRESEVRIAQQNRENEQQAIQQRRVEHIRWLSGILRQVIDHATRQANHLEEFWNEIERDSSKRYNLKQVASSAPERLARADNEATFHAFNTFFAADPNRNRVYRDLLAETDFITTGLVDIKTFYGRYTTDLIDRQRRIIDSFERSADDLSTLEVSMEMGGAQATRFHSDFHLELERMQGIYNSFKTTPVSLQQVIEDYARPLVSILVKEPYFPGAENLLKLTRSTIIAYNDMKATSKNFQKSFDPKPMRDHTANLAAILEAINQNLDGTRVPLPMRPVAQQA